MVPVDDEKEELEEKQIKEKEEQQEAQEENAEKDTKEDNKNILAEEYLNLARVIQADFDNYRKRSIKEIENARISGISNAVEVLLPSLDAFKKVKESVTDEKTLQGIEMLEKAILSGFEKLGVKKIDAVGLPLDPNYHNVLAVAKDETKEDGIVLDEFQAGYIMGDKVIRCSQVLVNKINN